MLDLCQVCLSMCSFSTFSYIHRQIFTFATDHQEAEDEAQADEEAGVHGRETEEMDHFSPKILSSELSTNNLIY